MTWESRFNSVLTLEGLIEALERDWPDHDWCVQRIANALERDRRKGIVPCHIHRNTSHFASILPEGFILSKGREGDRFVGFGDSALEAMKTAYSNLDNNIPDIGWRDYQDRRREQRNRRRGK